MNKPSRLPGPDAILWNVLALAQAILWFFALPPFLKPYWESFWGSFSPLVAQVVLNEMGFVYFVTIGALILPIYAGDYPFFEQFKISDKPWAWRSKKQADRDAFWALTRRSIKLYLFNYGVLVPLLTTGKYMLLDVSMSFSTDDWPSYCTLFKHNLALSLIHEFGFYWTHRISHHPTLYRFHKVHHEYHQNTILASMHEHPVDYVICLASPALFATVVVQPHSMTLFQWVIWLIVANIDDHAGYSFPWSPVRWFWGASTTDQHEYHHSHNKGCFASKLNIYDKLFDSEMPYQNWRARRAANRNKD